MLADADRAWLAGFFDGEGCIHIRSDGYAVRAQFTGTCPKSREHILALLAQAEVRARAYTQKRPADIADRHAACWKIVVQRYVDVARSSPPFWPHSP